MRLTPFLIVAALIAIPFAQANASHHPKDGKTLYGKKCASCHGADGVAKASGKGSANFNDPSFALFPVVFGRAPRRAHRSEAQATR